MTYPNVHLTEDGDVLLTVAGTESPITMQANWIDGPPALTPQRGYYHRVTLTLYVEQIMIDPGADFEIGQAPE